MKKIFILLFLILYQNNFSQNSDIDRLYEISFCGKPQTIQFIEYSNGTAEGCLRTELSEEIPYRKDREIIKEISLDNTLAKKIIVELKNAGIETLKKCNEDADCEALGFLDGDYLSINIQIKNINKHIEFSEIYPESQTNGKIEEIELRRKVQSLATIIDKEIDLEKQFSDLIKSLKRGKYCYWSGISKICIKHK
ncbi:hypothetical protein [Flavobacterium sp. ASV13]|uniref:hypothetical protein n=1 Tax=unclassified Flavobacterium TaxID=196869 RepID=UPI000B2CBE95|nr:hypothetical protein [Flavobacterium sp. ASV13]